MQHDLTLLSPDGLPHNREHHIQRWQHHNVAQDLPQIIRPQVAVVPSWLVDGGCVGCLGQQLVAGLHRWPGGRVRRALTWRT